MLHKKPVSIFLLSVSAKQMIWFQHFLKVKYLPFASGTSGHVRNRLYTFLALYSDAFLWFLVCCEIVSGVFSFLWTIMVSSIGSHIVYNYVMFTTISMWKIKYFQTRPKLIFGIFSDKSMRMKSFTEQKQEL